MYIKYNIIYIIYNIILVNSINTYIKNFNTHLLFQTLDLIKIFGRISEISLIGNVIPLNVERLGNLKIKNLKWKSIFKDKNEKLDLETFKNRLYNCSFTWPSDFITNQTTPFLIPLKFRHKYKLKCKCFPVNMEMYYDIKSKLNKDTLNNYIQNLPIHINSIDSTFKALSGEEEKLTIEHIIEYINYHSPLIQMINWNTFISSLPYSSQENTNTQGSSTMGASTVTSMGKGANSTAMECTMGKGANNITAPKGVNS
ncbi:uncharacterized protein TA04835 [Theileria annulata]|uniref:Uncharacterized protein n=1 Tax=Theileria annulata TaxID=5874 RepID=Q4UBU2_THEAN|nr:uncharacterized protein TA04835 [Theileria annulata]CAI75709.1 hypothetical protein, conserved [Theileria annulata]|eukprot:XP_955185.1 hypothetical protein, conserved [Theileria annulata]